METTILGLQNHFNRMYNRRVQHTGGSFPERAGHMIYRVGKIADAERKSERLPGRLARSVSYFYNVVNFFNGRVDLERGMMYKFPPYGCLYCTHMPCDCNDATRPDPKDYKLHDEQRGWTLRRWQEHLKTVYGWRHLQGDKFWKIYGRLVSEVGELSIIQSRGPHTPLRGGMADHQSELEAADVLSWLLTLAYVRGIDLEQEVFDRYQTCPGCNELVCDCDLVFIAPDGQSYSTVGVPGLYENLKITVAGMNQIL
ncbi:MAG: hypothetical protein V4519_02080 [Patescibacteria group bacterium]